MNLYLILLEWIIRVLDEVISEKSNYSPDEAEILAQKLESLEKQLSVSESENNLLLSRLSIERKVIDPKLNEAIQSLRWSLPPLFPAIWTNSRCSQSVRADSKEHSERNTCWSFDNEFKRGWLHHFFHLNITVKTSIAATGTIIEGKSMKLVVDLLIFGANFWMHSILWSAT